MVNSRFLKATGFHFYVDAPLIAMRLCQSYEYRISNGQNLMAKLAGHHSQFHASSRRRNEWYDIITPARQRRQIPTADRCRQVIIYTAALWLHCFTRCILKELAFVNKILLGTVSGLLQSEVRHRRRGVSFSACRRGSLAEIASHLCLTINSFSSTVRLPPLYAMMSFSLPHFSFIPS